MLFSDCFELFLSAFDISQSFKILRNNFATKLKIASQLSIPYFYSCEAVSRAKLYCGALGFLQFKEFELYWGAVFFFKICSHIFMIFEVKLEQ